MSDLGIGEAALISSLIGGGASVAGGLLQNKGSQTTAPTIDPAYGPLQQSVIDRVRQRLSSPIDTSGYAGTGIANINRTYDLAQQNVANSLTARGLNASPVAASAAATMQTGRAGDIAGFQNSLPLLARQLQGQDISQAASVLGLGRGTATNTESGGGAAGAATNLAQYLGYLTGKGVFNNMRMNGGTVAQPNTFSPGTDYLSGGSL